MPRNVVAHPPSSQAAVIRTVRSIRLIEPLAPDVLTYRVTGGEKPVRGESGEEATGMWIT